MIQTLKKRQDFLKAAREKHHWVTPSFILQIYKLSPTDTVDKAEHHFGFTAARKSVGNAVKRNRAKRRLRALIHDRKTLFQEILETKGPYGFVFIARAHILEADFAQMQKDCRWALKRLGLLDKK